MSKDYYQTLGVPRAAPAAEIKKAYRRLARKFHPDLNPGDKGSEARFKEIQEAYAVLSDPKKKAQYDQYGFAGEMPPGGPGAGPGAGGSGFEGFDFSDGGSSSFRDFFENIFGGRTPAEEPAGPAPGEDLHYTMNVGFEDAVRGLETRIRLNRLVACADCGGEGTVAAGRAGACPACRGTGRTQLQRGFMKFSSPCPECGGTGRTRGRACGPCGGEGLVSRSELVTVRIPAGVDTGSKVRVPGKGNDGRHGGPPGDLYILLEVAPHPVFRRDGPNLSVRVPVTVPEATLGAKIEVPTLDGRATIRIPPGTKSGQKFRLRGEGAPLPGRKTRGDAFVEVFIVPPPFQDQRVRELMKELEKVSGPNPRGVPGSDGHETSSER